MLNWIGFNPETHRAYVGKDGLPVIEPIPQELIEARQLDTDAARLAVAMRWASRFPIDKPIDVECNGPAGVMARRRMYGYTWVTALLMPNIENAPGVGHPGVKNFYDPGAAPVGSILVPPV